jgi:hypothetical protein
MKWSSRPGERTFLIAATAILLVAALFRMVALRDVPPGLAQDEVLDADIAGFILEGRHALFFREGYGHEPLYHYWAVPFRVLLGDNLLSVRLPAVFLGLLLVAGTMRWARRDYGLLAAAVAGTGLAVSWWPIIFSRIGIRPIAEPVWLVFAAVVWPRRPWLAGLFLGAAIYSYTAARTIFVLPLLVALYLLLARPQDSSPWNSLRAAILVFLVAVACYLPLALTLRADPTLQQRVDQLAGPLEAARAGDFRPVLQTTLATLGVFSIEGDPRWTYSIPGRPLFDPLTALLFYGGLAIAIARWRTARYALLLLWLAITLLPSALTPQAPSTVRLVGAMPVVYLLPGLAASWLWQRLRQRSTGRTITRWAVAVAGIVLVLLNAGRTIRDGFQLWPQSAETRLRYQTTLLEIARHWDEQQGAGALVVADAYFEPIDGDSLRRNLGRPLPARWIQVGPDVAGAVVWPGEVSLLYVPEYALAPAAFFAVAGAGSEPAYRSSQPPGFAVYSLPVAPDPPEHGMQATFEETIALTGYSTNANSDAVAQLVTYWMVLAPLPADLAIFVHVVDANGNIVAQHDAFDAAAALLQPGDTVAQLHPLPAGLQEQATIRLGLYRRGDGSRLHHDGAPSDAVLLPAGG